MPTLEIGLALAVLSFVGIIYPHAIYPLILKIIHRFSSDPVSRSTPHQGSVNVIIAAYNEETRIERCLQSIYSSDYPKHLLRVVVGDDGSTDRTVDVVTAFSERHPDLQIAVVRLHRTGKNGVISRLISQCDADIAVFTDADCVLATEALTMLIAPFHEVAVGAVVGKNDRAGHRDSADPGARGEALYRSMEDVINQLESEIASTVASNGALYAVRREYLRPLPNARVADDWMNTLNVALQGARIIFEPAARVVEERTNTLQQESKRTIRTVSSGISALLQALPLMLPSAGWIAFFLFSHRVVRWASPLFVLLMIPATALTISEPIVFGVLFYSQALLYAFALIGKAAARYDQHVPLASTCLFFVAMNISFLLGIATVLRGGRLDTWTPTESQS